MVAASTASSISRLLAAASEVAGTNYFFQPGTFAFIGFDGIAIANSKEAKQLKLTRKDLFLALAATFAPQPLQAPAIGPDDLSSVNFTGGTTGKPKGVMGTHRAVAYMTQIQMAEWEFPEPLRMLIATPLSHAAAAFFPGPFERSAIITMDGVGEWSTSSWGTGSVFA